MTNFNRTLQQVIGYSSLLGVLNKSTPKEVNGGQESYKNFSDSVRANIRRHGIQKTSMAHIVFNPPNLFGTQSKIAFASKIAALATYRGDTFTQPGVSMATTEIKRYGVGPIERKPYLPIFTDQQFTFINDSQSLIHKFFYLWMNGIVGYDALPQGGAARDIFNKFPYEVEYKDQYTTTIDMYIYNEVQNKVGVLKLENAYPLFLGDIQRGWADTDQLVRFPVTFTYSHWRYDDLSNNLDPEAFIVPTARKNLSLSQSLMKYAAVIQTLSSTKRPQNVNDILNIVNSGSTILKSMFPPSVEPKYNDYYSNVGRDEG